MKRVVSEVAVVPLNTHLPSLKMAIPTSSKCAQNTTLSMVLIGFVQLQSQIGVESFENRFIHLLKFVLRLREQGVSANMHVLKNYSDTYDNTICRQSHFCVVHTSNIQDTVLHSSTKALKLLHNVTNDFGCMQVKHAIIVFSDAILDEFFIDRVLKSGSNTVKCLEATHTYAIRGLCRAFVFTTGN